MYIIYIYMSIYIYTHMYVYIYIDMCLCGADLPCFRDSEPRTWSNASHVVADGSPALLEVDEAQQIC